MVTRMQKSGVGGYRSRGGALRVGVWETRRRTEGGWGRREKAKRASVPSTVLYFVSGPRARNQKQDEQDEGSPSSQAKYRTSTSRGTLGTKRLG